jgi:hypothetical protein
MSISRPGVVLAIALCVLAGDATVPDVRPAELLPRDWLSVHILGPDGRPVRNAELRLFFCTPDGVPFGRSEDLFEAEVAAADPATSAAPSETRPTTMPTTRPRRGRFQSLEPHELDESLRATTDDDGDVGISLGRLRPIPPGTRLGARVELGGRWHFGYGSDTAPEDVFHWIAGTLRLAPEPAALSGVVVDERGLPASVTEFYAVFARSPAELARFSITERPFRVEADGHFRIQPEPAWPPPGTEATVIYGLAWEAPRFLRVVLGSSGVRLVIPRNAATLSGRIELAGLDPAELFVCVEQERTPGISGHWFHDYLVERRGKTRRILGKIEQDGSFRIEQAPTGVVSFIVGAGRPDRMGERNPIPAEAELIRLDGGPALRRRAVSRSALGDVGPFESIRLGAYPRPAWTGSPGGRCRGAVELAGRTLVQERVRSPAPRRGSIPAERPPLRWRPGREGTLPSSAFRLRRRGDFRRRGRAAADLHLSPCGGDHGFGVSVQSRDSSCL